MCQGVATPTPAEGTHIEFILLLLIDIKEWLQKRNLRQIAISMPMESRISAFSLTFYEEAWK
jgi:hypothetical protein